MKYLNPEEHKASQKDKNTEKEDLLKLFKPNTTLVYEIEHYPGLFRDRESKVYDLRPNNEEIIRPSLDSFAKLPQQKL